MPVPCPWSRAELDEDFACRIDVEEACEFIARCKEEHGRRLGWAVGEYLYVRFYREDEEYLRRLDSTKDDSLEDVAAGSGLPYTTLYKWTMAALVRRKLADAGIEWNLGITILATLDRLRDHLPAMLLIARWATVNRPTVAAVERLVAEWRAHLDAGRSLREIARRLPEENDEPEPAPRPRRKGGKGRRRRADETKVERLLGIVLRDVQRHWFGEADAGRVRPALLRARGLLAAAGGKG